MFKASSKSKVILYLGALWNGPIQPVMLTMAVKSESCSIAVSEVRQGFVTSRLVFLNNS